ncbi:serine/threonine protein kinase [Lactiplantibacillus carotarum]|uniref:serine/threonine protein kinase n=1 Tax=Lactiplantibacillus carotarum TaxID=2993456 RepID=UPI00298F03B4|nr:protein kinase [Lactiplantibacillus carotarum]
MLPILQATQLLNAANYNLLGPLIDHHDFPLLVKKAGIVYVAKLARQDELPVLQTLASHPVDNMPRIQPPLIGDDCIVSVETLINGHNLAEVLVDHGPYAPIEVAQVADELLQALTQLARLKLVHRDIKLSNVVVSHGHYYLIDVNAARQYQENQSTDTRLLGTSGFAAPENYGFAQTDQRSDLFALGIVLKALLTGQVPVDSLDRTAWTPPDRLWRHFIQKATALDPSKRYQSAQTMRAAVPGHRFIRYPFAVGVQFSQHNWPIIKTSLWISYCCVLVIFSYAAVSGEATWGARFYNLWLCFIYFASPAAAHFINLWLYKHLPNFNWLRYRGWLRANEVVIYFVLLATSHPSL